MMILKKTIFSFVIFSTFFVGSFLNVNSVQAFDVISYDRTISAGFDFYLFTMNGEFTFNNPTCDILGYDQIVFFGVPQIDQNGFVTQVLPYGYFEREEDPNFIYALDPEINSTVSLPLNVNFYAIGVTCINADSLQTFDENEYLNNAVNGGLDPETETTSVPTPLYFEGSQFNTTPLFYCLGISDENPNVEENCFNPIFVFGVTSNGLKAIFGSNSNNYINNIIGSIRETGVPLLPIAGFVGVPLAFFYGRRVITLIKSAI